MTLSICMVVVRSIRTEQLHVLCCELDGDQKQLLALEVQTLDVIRPDN